MRSKGGASEHGCDAVSGAVGLDVDAMMALSAQVHSDGGDVQSKARTSIVPLSGGRSLMLFEMFSARTESMTSGRSVERTSQPRALRARLEVLQNAVRRSCERAGRKPSSPEDGSKRDTYAERPIPLPSSSTLGRLEGTAWAARNLLLGSRESHADRTCAPIQSAVPFVLPLSSCARWKRECLKRYARTGRCFVL